MQAFTFLIFVTSSICLNFGGSFADPDITTTEFSVEVIPEDVADAVDLYKNFTDSVFSVLSELGDNNTELATEVENDGGSIASLLGISYILASTNEQVWPLSYPIFDDIMNGISFDVLDALDTVLLDIKDTLTFTNILFATPTINASSGSKNLVELIEVDFEEDDATIPIINESIYNFTNGVLQHNYIQDGIIIPSSTLAIAVNIVQTKSIWPSPLTPVGRKYFNKREIGNMLQFRGEVKYTEEDGEVELIIYFQNVKSGLALRMPKDIDTDRSVANIETLPLATPSNVTIVIPELKYTLRSSYDLNADNSTDCDFNKQPNMLQILDVLTYINLAADYFQIVSVSGAQIVNVNLLVEEIRNHTDSISKDDSSREDQLKRRQSLKNNPVEDPDVVDLDYSEVDDNPQESSEIKLENALYKANSLDNEIVPEKVFLFNKPFTWMIFDDYVVPILAGVVSSLKPPEDIPPPIFTLLGTEGNKVSPYLQCFENEASA
ncbi:unnamed protein product [Allacma fusca]|uniref:Uncharacterized protein n=1 Tax=Allacma fusca TaxID=39272 RepID=A0A8J2KAJ2_9HEXA|nr:unnamed protein product [Allacma fusca]